VSVSFLRVHITGGSPEIEIEIEFSALSRQCLNRRIPCFEQMQSEILALVKEREDKGIHIHWQFSLTKARHKFQRHYQALHTEKNANPLR
jgi:hypothetical protein